MSVPALALKSLGDEPVAENFVRDLSMELGLNMKSSASLPPPRTSGAEHNLPFSMSINSSQQELAGNGHAAKQRSGDEQMSGGSGFVANRWTDGLGQPPLHGGWDAPFQPLKADEAQSTYYYGNGSDERPVHTPVANFSDLTPREGAPGNASAMDAAALAMPPLRSGSGSATPALGSSPRLHPSSNPCSPRLPLVASNSSTPRGNTQPPSGSGGSHTEILLEKAKTGRGSDVASPNSPSEYSHGRHPPARSRLGGAGRMSLELDENRHTPRSNLSGAGSLASNGAVASDWNVSSDLDADRHTPRSNLSGAGSLASNGAVASDWNVSSNGAVQLRSKSGESEPLLNKGKKRIMLSTVKLGGLSDPAQETTNSFTIPANHGDGSDLKPVEVASDLILSKVCLRSVDVLSQRSA